MHVPTSINAICFLPPPNRPPVHPFIGSFLLYSVSAPHCLPFPPLYPLSPFRIRPLNTQQADLHGPALVCSATPLNPRPCSSSPLSPLSTSPHSTLTHSLSEQGQVGVGEQLGALLSPLPPFLHSLVLPPILFSSLPFFPPLLSPSPLFPPLPSSSLPSPAPHPLLIISLAPSLYMLYSSCSRPHSSSPPPSSLLPLPCPPSVSTPLHTTHSKLACGIKARPTSSFPLAAFFAFSPFSPSPRNTHKHLTGTPIHSRTLAHPLSDREQWGAFLSSLPSFSPSSFLPFCPIPTSSLLVPPVPAPRPTVILPLWTSPLSSLPPHSSPRSRLPVSPPQGRGEASKSVKPKFSVTPTPLSFFIPPSLLSITPHPSRCPVIWRQLACVGMRRTAYWGGGGSGGEHEAGAVGASTRRGQYRKVRSEGTGGWDGVRTGALERDACKAGGEVVCRGCGGGVVKGSGCGEHGPACC
ncbi:unnamed protein product [Closterium sp. Naga37s-1]|nr:unnamed protein product [Closterium sp. Naga37s-1]